MESRKEVIFGSDYTKDYWFPQLKKKRKTSNFSLSDWGPWDIMTLSQKVILLRFLVMVRPDTPPKSSPYQSVNSVSHFRALSYFIIHCQNFPVIQSNLPTKLSVDFLIFLSNFPFSSWSSFFSFQTWNSRSLFIPWFRLKQKCFVSE